MKPQSKVLTALSTRCSHRTETGRQCRQLAADSRSCLCAHHLDLQKQTEISDLSRTLLARSQNFQTAQGVNFALANIYRLLAANRISARRASVLAYINSLLLRTLPAIDYDHATGHKDPTAPDDETDRDDDEIDMEDDETASEDDIELDSRTLDVQTPIATIPEPDPTKKTS